MTKQQDADVTGSEPIERATGSAAKQIVKSLLLLPLHCLDALGRGYSALIAAIHPTFSTYWLDAQNDRIQARRKQISHVVKGVAQHFSFYTPNWICQFRAATFSTKEPETLEWMDTYGGKGALFDIGANVGLYSVYYAKTQPGNVYAFEPSVFNLRVLAKNLNANDVESKVKIIPNPLTTTNCFADFNLTTTMEGGALSSFGVDYGQDGTPMNKVFAYQTCGFSLDFLMEAGVVAEYPSLIKVDVDGIEHLILRGAVKTLAHPQCKTVLIEVNDAFAELSTEVQSILTGAGFRLETRAQAEMFHASAALNNQIWIKS